MKPSPQHVAFMDDLKAALAKHVDLSAQEMLAVASQFVGNLTALQDASRYSPDQVMNMVARNIEIGNQMAAQVAIRSQGGVN